MTTKTSPINVMIVDDHTLVRHAVKRLISADKRFHVMGEAWDQESCLELLEVAKPHIIIMDITLKRTDGLHLTRLCLRRHPHAKVIIFTMHDESIYGTKATQLGAVGYIMKDTPPDALLDAIEEVLANPHGFTDKVANWILREGRAMVTPTTTPIDGLSNRERQVFALIGTGHSTSKIAKTLGIGMKTVETHRSRIKAKLGLRDATELIMSATRWYRDQNGSPEDPPRAL